MSAPALADAGALPGNVRLRALYKRLFRVDIIGPAIVIVITIAGGYFGLRISGPTWPLAALAVGGIAAALWRIVGGDRSRAADLVTWHYADQTRRWEAAGLALPVSAVAARAWIASSAFRAAKPADQVHALVAVGDLDRADKILANARSGGAEETADLAAARFDVEFSRNGDADFSQWRAAVNRLKPAIARRHKASMAIYEAAVDLAERRMWLITLDKAAVELGPFENPPARRILRRLYPVIPVLLGISIVEVGVLLFGWSRLAG